MEFKVGDIVEAWGQLGTVEEIVDEDQYPIRVVMHREGLGPHWFTKDGREWDWHRTVLLKFVSRPKKKVKKTFYTMIFDTIIGRSAGLLFDTVEKCRAHNGGIVAQIVPIDIEVDENSLSAQPLTERCGGSMAGKPSACGCGDCG